MGVMTSSTPPVFEGHTKGVVRRDMSHLAVLCRGRVLVVGLVVEGVLLRRRVVKVPGVSQGLGSLEPGGVMEVSPLNIQKCQGWGYMKGAQGFVTVHLKTGMQRVEESRRYDQNRREVDFESRRKRGSTSGGFIVCVDPVGSYVADSPPQGRESNIVRE
eukprot:757464-Hanusia_phi.AAC.7